MITFIPNDPLAKTGPTHRKIKPRAKRPAKRADFAFSGEVTEGVYEFGTAEFLFWQCRESALLAVEVWEVIDGNLKAWGTSSPKRLTLNQNAGLKLNAAYTQASLDFYEFTTGTKTTFSGASTDVVAHEAGHAFLDSLRPELWDTSFTETNAFHEAFGDCMAILTALSDKSTRDSLLKVTGDLSKKNFVETLMEDLADGFKRDSGADFDASGPRRALNNFKWQLPTTLPTSGKPAVLTSEIHSFGRVFAGCFYDALRNVFARQVKQDQANLWKAAQTVGKLLTAGAREAPETPRFFQSVGRAMVLADEKLNKGANRSALTAAFTRHGISLGTAAMLTPRSSLAGAAPNMGKKKGAAILTPTTRDDLKRRIGAAPTARLSVIARSIGDESIAEATHHREISLGSLSKDLAGVVVFAAEPVLVGTSGKRAAIVSAMPDENVTTDEVHTFVQTLLEADSIEFDGGPSTAGTRGIRSAGAMSAAAEKPRRTLPTHIIRKRGNQKVLERIRFVC
jgi:Fungalysin metallopeptidase (M36)